MNKHISNITLLNLPNNEKITRRYMCSYTSPVSLFPPYELLSVGGIIKEELKININLIDAIADNCNLEFVINKLKQNIPDVIITITGFECYNDDVLAINAIKNEFQNTLIFVIGHYPTIFPKETLIASLADFILHGEPDLSVIQLLSALENSRDISKIDNISFFDAAGDFHTTHTGGRISDINNLPLPIHQLLLSDSYSEPLLPKPYAIIQTARGCPYQCNFCVKSFGSRLTEKSPERIIEEIMLLVKTRKINSFRFTDDTFTLNTKRVIKICQLIIQNNLSYLKWTCLSRVDNINEEMLFWLKKAGCARIYFGIESGSKKILQILNKNTDVESSLKSLQMVKRYGIQTSGFFMLGIPGETIQDIDLSIKYAIEAKLDFIAIGNFTPYPGTPIFDKFKSDIDFSIFPYKLQFKNINNDNYVKYEKYFYKKFYYRFAYILDKIKFVYTKPMDFVSYFASFIFYSLGLKSNALNHVQISGNSKGSSL